MDAEQLHVRFYSDSLGLPRPQLNISNKDRYISILSQYWKNKYGKDIEILDRARADMSIIDMLKWFNEDCGYFGKKIDILIIHNGIVDCAPRPIPSIIRRIVSRLPQFIQRRVINILHKHRSVLLNLGFRFYVTTPKEYYKHYKQLVEKAVSISKVIYLINIAPTNPKIENHSPGFTKSINRYNSIISSIIDEIKNENIYLIDIYSCINFSKENINEFINQEDGHHITKKAHDMCANLIIQKENIQ